MLSVSASGAAVPPLGGKAGAACGTGGMEDLNETRFHGSSGTSHSSTRPNPKGGRTLIVDARDPHAYIPAQRGAEGGRRGPIDFSSVPVCTNKCSWPTSLCCSSQRGRDHVRSTAAAEDRCASESQRTDYGDHVSVRGKRSAFGDESLDSVSVTQCRATEGVLSGRRDLWSEARATFVDNESVTTGNPASLSLPVLSRVADNQCFGNHHFGLAVRDPGKPSGMCA